MFHRFSGEAFFRHRNIAGLPYRSGDPSIIGRLIVGPLLVIVVVFAAVYGHYERGWRMQNSERLNRWLPQRWRLAGGVGGVAPMRFTRFDNVSLAGGAVDGGRVEDLVVAPPATVEVDGVGTVRMSDDQQRRAFDNPLFGGGSGGLATMDDPQMLNRTKDGMRGKDGDELVHELNIECGDLIDVHLDGPTPSETKI